MFFIGLSPAAAPSGIPTSDASKIGLQGLRWNFHFFSIQLIFLCFIFLSEKECVSMVFIHHLRTGAHNWYV